MASRVARWAFAAVYGIVALIAVWGGVVQLNPPTPPPNPPFDPNPAVFVNSAMFTAGMFYFLTALAARVVDCVFEDWKPSPAGGQYKIISFYAKRARGLMARFAIEQRVSNPESLKKFNSEGYTFVASLSSEDKLVFRRAG